MIKSGKVFSRMGGRINQNTHLERIERSMVLGRKNCWENHSEWGGEFSAIMLSVIQTCIMHKISPKAHCLHRIFTTQTLIP
jgi:hypothetical protein